MEPPRSNLVKVSWLFCLLILPSCGEERHEDAPIAQAESFLSCLDATQPSFLEARVTATFVGKSLPQIIKSLSEEHGLPVSFIEGPEPVQIEMLVQGEPVRSFLSRLLGQAQGYRCSVIEDHVVIYHDEPALHVVVRNVSITQEFRGKAAGSYVKIVSGQIKAFGGLSVLLGGPLESTFFTDRVTLAREAAVLRHLCQLLGKYPDACFSLRYASVGGRYLTMGTATSENPIRHRLIAN